MPLMLPAAQMRRAPTSSATFRRKIAISPGDNITPMPRSKGKWRRLLTEMTPHDLKNSWYLHPQIPRDKLDGAIESSQPCGGFEPRWARDDVRSPPLSETPRCAQLQGTPNRVPNSLAHQASGCYNRYRVMHSVSAFGSPPGEE